MSAPEADHRKRSLAALFAGVAVSATGYLAIVTVLPLVAEDLLGSARFSGVPSALGIFGTAVGATWLSKVIARRGARAGLSLGYLTAAFAALAAAGAATLGAFPLLAGAVFVIGAGYGASRLSRYAAAALSDPSRRASAISWNLWASTTGSVLGPMILEPTRRLAEAARVPAISGPFLLGALSFGAAWIVLTLGLPAGTGTAPAESPDASSADAGWTAGALVAIVALVAGQVVMVLVMTMTPVHIRSGGEGLASIGVVIASHTFGMYALSPLSGLLTDRFGRRPMLLAAVVLLAGSSLLAARAPVGTPWLALALFLLGLGWNFSFVTGSALLTESVPAARRVHLQGYADSAVWLAAALAGGLSGVLLEAIGYASLSRLAAMLALVPLAAMALAHLGGGSGRAVLVKAR